VEGKGESGGASQRRKRRSPDRRKRPTRVIAILKKTTGPTRSSGRVRPVQGDIIEFRKSVGPKSWGCNEGGAPEWVARSGLKGGGDLGKRKDGMSKRKSSDEPYGVSGDRSKKKKQNNLPLAGRGRLNLNRLAAEA